MGAPAERRAATAGPVLDLVEVHENASNTGPLVLPPPTALDERALRKAAGDLGAFVPAERERLREAGLNAPKGGWGKRGPILLRPGLDHLGSDVEPHARRVVQAASGPDSTGIAPLPRGVQGAMGLRGPSAPAGAVVGLPAPSVPSEAPDNAHQSFVASR